MINMLTRAIGDVLTPLVGRVILFVGEDAMPYYKTSDGVVHSMVGAKGDKGDPGEKGDKGDPGNTGGTGPAGPGVPVGGSAGQVLRKTGAANYATEWASVGTAAYANIATGSTATQGSDVLPAGFMGLAADSIQTRNNISTLDNCTLSGLYRAAAGATNNPEATGAFICQHMPSGGTANQFGIQIATSDTTARSYVRLKSSGVFGTWIAQAFDNQVVHNTGAEIVGGAKTFTASPVLNAGADIANEQNIRFGSGGGVARGNATGNVILGGGSPTSGGVIIRGDITAGSARQVVFNADGSVSFAAGQAATRTSLGAVGLTGDETVSGYKTWNSQHTWNIGSTAQITYGQPGGDSTGITMFFGVSDARRRSDIRGRAGDVLIGCANTNESQPTQFLSIAHGNIKPNLSNVMSLGLPSNLWTQVCATNGTINTSDARLKTKAWEISPKEAAAFSAILRLPGVWQWLARREEEGDMARWHAGPIVQAAIAVMTAHGLDWERYSAFCHDQWPAQEERWHEWPAVEEQWEEWEAQEAQYEVIPAAYDEEGNMTSPEIHRELAPAVEAGRRLVREAVPGGRELVEPAVEAGDVYSFRRSELHWWCMRALACQHDALEARVSALEQSRA